MCDEWLNSFEAFLAYIGPRPSPQHSVDRINVNGHYEPGNVRWATHSEQAKNRRRVGDLTAFTTQELQAELQRRGALEPSQNRRKH
jgi:regulator of sirC expression with transglutaminase-like and TPR domain